MTPSARRQLQARMKLRLDVHRTVNALTALACGSGPAAETAHLARAVALLRRPNFGEVPRTALLEAIFAVRARMGQQCPQADVQTLWQHALAQFALSIDVATGRLKPGALPFAVMLGREIALYDAPIPAAQKVEIFSQAEAVFDDQYSGGIPRLHHVQNYFSALSRPAFPVDCGQRDRYIAHALAVFADAGIPSKDRADGATVMLLGLDAREARLAVPDAAGLRAKVKAALEMLLVDPAIGGDATLALFLHLIPVLRYTSDELAELRQRLAPRSAPAKIDRRDFVKAQFVADCEVLLAKLTTSRG